MRMFCNGSQIVIFCSDFGRFQNNYLLKKEGSLGGAFLVGVKIGVKLQQLLQLQR